jgi:hypothetical protein
VITHIDLALELRRSVCALYSNLVTRPTGAAVRLGIEQQISDLTGRILTVVDFANVSLLDFSCADEVVAKLMLKYCSSEAATEAYFLFRGISEAHLEAIETVLERHRLAIVVQQEDGTAMIVGQLSEEERIAWQTVSARRRLSSGAIAETLNRGLLDARSVLDQLHSRRLLIRLDDEYIALGEMFA